MERVSSPSARMSPPPSSCTSDEMPQTPVDASVRKVTVAQIDSRKPHGSVSIASSVTWWPSGSRMHVNPGGAVQPAATSTTPQVSPIV
jgi:hypothetical protein